MAPCPPATFSGLLFVFQVVLLIIFATLGDYGLYVDPVLKPHPSPADTNSIPYFYPMFQDIHVMVFLGIGFLLTYLKKYGYGSVSYNLFIGAVILQWSAVINAWMGHAFDGVASAKFLIDIKTLITSDFAAATVLISFGGVLGKISKLQMLLLGIFEVVFYALNEKILFHKLQIADVSGSMVIHAFAAYFGVAVARVIHTKDHAEENPKEGSTYTSDLFSMIGTVFLWLFWPSFNAGLLGPGTQQNRAIINTYFSMSACVISVFIISPLLNKNGKMSMVHVQNATLAGGVAVGTMADMVIKPWGAIFVGMAAGTVCSLGFTYLTPFLNKRFNLHDTCGIHNLHGLPGILSGVGGAIAASSATEKNYGDDLYSLWPARKTVLATNTTAGIEGRTASTQAGFQIAALFITIALAIVGGIITGFIIKFVDPPSKNQLYDDSTYWVLPEEADDNCNDAEMYPMQEATKTASEEEKV